uniref:PROP1-like PPR domain-containing protein n=1 Tax=Aureoumbra lagunensis TaxID=44058 RepID=A0A7S3NQ32_9STRA
MLVRIVEHSCLQQGLALKIAQCLPILSSSVKYSLQATSEIRNCDDSLLKIRHELHAPSLDQCNSALDYFRQEGRWVCAIELLSRMKKNSIYPKPQETAYNAVIRSCEEHGEWRMALDFALDSRSSGIDWQRRSTYLSSLKACAQGSKYQLALELLDEQRSKLGGELIPSHAATLWACSNAGEVDLTLQILQDMQKQGITPCATSYAAAIAVCEKTGRWTTGIQLLDEMRAKGLTPSVETYLASLNLALMGGEWDRSFELINDCRLRGVNGIDKRFDHDIQASHHATEQSNLALRLVEREPTSLVAFNAAISACEKSHQWDRVLELFDNMCDNGLEPNVGVYNSAINACAMTNQSARGLFLLNTFLETHDTKPDVSTIDQLIWACISDGNWNETKRLKAIRALN